jgi:hypothetical protein
VAYLDRKSERAAAVVRLRAASSFSARAANRLELVSSGPPPPASGGGALDLNALLLLLGFLALCYRERYSQRRPDAAED